ncbi:unnamed protein product [Blepharisma stoltei]|uniref:Palmitoyltransferase n=1 Tax=Blepharisma stoltei TaxID=1481888 RepID=A0AAU9K575_9CILI|nr:unnamed protein product [Blepharisma stoltei]
MEFWGFLIYTVISVSILFILLCVSPHGTGPFAWLSRQIFITLPAITEKISIKLFGPMGSSKISYYFLYIFNKPNPSFQIVYLLLSLGGFTIYFFKGFAFVPNRYVPSIHIYTGTAFYMLCVTIFYLACTVSPGKIRPQNEEKYKKIFPYDEALYREVKCSTCDLVKPARSKHCSVCNICVAKFDHHCIWINQCVGYGNYKWFLAFILSHSLLCMYGAQIGLLIFVHIIEKERIMTTRFFDYLGNEVEWSWMTVIQYLLQRYPSWFFVVTLCFIMGLTLTGFFFYHLYLVYENTTSNERAKRLDLAESPKYKHLAEKPNIYNKGFFKNIEEVICAKTFK